MTHPGWEDWTIVAATDEPSASVIEKQERARRRRRRRVRRRVARVARWSLLAVGLVVLGVCGWVALDTRSVQADLEAAADGAADLQAQVLAGDTARVSATVADVQRHAAAAKQATGRAHWTIATGLPWIGPNVSAVRTVADAVDGLARHALPSLAGVADVLNPAGLAPVDGTVDLAPLAASAGAVISADAAVQGAADQLAAVDADALVGPVANAVERVRSQVDEVSSQTRTAARAVRLLPPMLGADEPRDYLLLVQNNAEPRASGGNPGVLVQVRVEDGGLEIVDQRTALELGQFTDPVVPLEDAEVALFGTQLGRFMQDVTFTPHFPRTGELARAMWLDRTGVEVDGVVSVDPVALQAVLAATGPVVVDGEELTGENAAARLLNGVYLDRPDPAAQDAFFAQAATRVFEALTTDADASVALDALVEQAREGRILVWSAREEEQAQLSGTVLAGEVRGQAGDRPVVGVFVNDGSAAKIGYYLDVEVALESTSCRPNGSQALTLRVTLTSSAPQDAATSLPPYVTGSGYGFVDPGSMALNVLVYAPAGGAIEDVHVSDGPQGLLSQVHEGVPVGARSVSLDPGDTVTLDVRLVSGPDSSGDPLLRTTPGPRSLPADVTASACT